MPDPARSKCAGVHWLRVEPRQCGLKALEFSASGGAAAVRGSGASPDSAVPGSNRRAQAIHGLLAPDPRTTASFATWMSVASSMPVPAARRQCPPKRRTPRSRRTSLQGDFVRADRVCVEPGCTAPACWSRTRNHAADEIPLQRRPLPEARLLPLQRRPRPEARLLPLQRRPPPEAKLLPLQRRTHAPQSGEQPQKRPGLPSRPFADAASRPLVTGSRRPVPGRLPRSPPRSGSGCSAGRRASRR